MTVSDFEGRKYGLNVLTVTVIAFLAVACGSDDPQTDAAPAPVAKQEAAPAQASKATDVPRNAYFGDTHVHTGWSADAGMDGVITSPDDAYRFALGETIKSNTGMDAKIGRAYDWFLVSDHSDGMGTINEIIAKNPQMAATTCTAT